MHHTTAATPCTTSLGCKKFGVYSAGQSVFCGCLPNQMKPFPSMSHDLKTPTTKATVACTCAGGGAQRDVAEAR
jgi:hypothetical protein